MCVYLQTCAYLCADVCSHCLVLLFAFVAVSLALSVFMWVHSFTAKLLWAFSHGETGQFYSEIYRYLVYIMHKMIWPKITKIKGCNFGQQTLSRAGHHSCFCRNWSQVAAVFSQRGLNERRPAAERSGVSISSTGRRRLQGFTVPVNDCVIHAATVSIGGSQRDPPQ